MAEAMFANLERAVIFDWVDLQAPFDQIPSDIGASTEHVREPALGLLKIGQATGVMIEFNVGREERHEMIHIMSIESLKDSRIHPGYRVEQFSRLRIGLWRGRCTPCLP